LERAAIEEKMQKLTEEIADYKKKADDPNENLIERNKACEYASWKLNERTDLKKELDRLKKGNYQTSENIEMETFNENESARQQREKEIQAENEVQQTVLNADDSTPEEKARAAETKRELEQEVNEREGEISQLRLRDRIREKVKAICYGCFACCRHNHRCYSQFALKRSEKRRQRCGERFQSSWQTTG